MALCMERGSNTGDRPSLKMRHCQSFDRRTRPAVHFFCWRDLWQTDGLTAIPVRKLLNEIVTGRI